MESSSKLVVGIIGSGKIGTDLLIKALRSPYLDCELFVGRDYNSPGLQKAMSVGVNTSNRSLDAFEAHKARFDLVFDATSAECHKEHAPYFAAEGIKAIDLTPARMGSLCIPAIDGDSMMMASNVNMVTCGGQASIPIINTLSQVYPGIERVEIKSILAEDSVGPATWANIDDYYATTSAAISQYSGIEDVAVELNVEKSSWRPDMLTYIRAYTGRGRKANLEALFAPLQNRLAEVRRYASGYSVIGTPTCNDGVIDILVCVRGAGDWIPSHAGNLDIINCAALAVAEQYARSLGIQPWAPVRREGSYIGKFFRPFAGAAT